MKGKQMRTTIETPIKDLHPAKTPPNALGEFIETLFGVVFFVMLFWGSFALAAYLCAVF